MTDLRARWRLRPSDPRQVASLATRHGLPEVVAALLCARGHADGARAFLEASLRALHDPRLLPDMPAAAARVARAIRAGEPILIHGDYDVDGVTGTALLVRLVRAAGGRVHAFVPNRFEHGYSFGPHSVEAARACEAGVVVSVDNGTSSGETIAELARQGVDVVVTDHHEPPPGPLPEAVAVVNPKRADSRYPFRELCGAGVAFKLAWAVAQELSGGERVSDELRRFLVQGTAFAALATVCDVVPLVDENRVLARRGLSALQGAPTAGLAALLEVAGLADRPVLYAEDVAFQLGPRLNAAGRLGAADRAVELLLCDERDAARALARELDERNVERRRIERALLEEALAEAHAYEDLERWPALVLARQGWHQGVLGIVAARLAERFRRPTLLIGLDGERGRGSARSVPGFSVLDALHGGAERMLRYGGHAQAAGCEVLAGQVDALRDAVCARTRELACGGGGENGVLWIDWDLPLRQMNDGLMRSIERLEPFGERNEKPLLLSSDLRLAQPARTIGEDGAHLLLRVRSGDHALKALAFGLGHRAGELRMGVPLHLVYTPRWSTFRGETSLELVVADFACGPRPI